MPFKIYYYLNVQISLILQIYKRAIIVFLGKKELVEGFYHMGNFRTFIQELETKSRLGLYMCSS